ncbi:alpha/beta fold hydrolase [Ramlibacter sp. GTP1]|uniref:Alpha/beta fold hydrolase n=2 Tax=Ramlibacter albus TaxID=2079448 RepID=A0A923MAJ2_9BURK|nr:alpha/beta fold hydrolase [Ramlibacter albus]
MLRVCLAGAVLALTACAAPQGAGGRQVVMEEFRVPSDPGIQVYVRNKRPADMTNFSSAKTVLYVHGATYPSSTAFDLQLDGMSWMDYIARNGYDVYLLDLRGYGHSTRPPQMDRPAGENPPFAGTEEAMRDVDAVVEFIRKRRGVDKVNLLAWSWGTAIMQWYTSLNNHKVEKLALYAPVWIRQSASLVQAGPGPTPAYRTVRMSDAKGRWLTGVAPDKQAALIPAGWFEAWAKATFETDPWGMAQNPPVLRAPNGVVADGLRYWGNGIIPWKVEDIRVPVLLVKAEWDMDTPSYMAQNLFPKLVNAPWKRYVELGEGTHSIIMERNRMDLFRTVQQFLDEPRVR